jgi:hypothetical protein
MTGRERLPNRRASQQISFARSVASSPLGVALDLVADDLKVTKITESE